MVGILVSFWEGPFSGAMLVLGRVRPFILKMDWTPPKIYIFDPQVMKVWLEDDFGTGFQAVSGWFFSLVPSCKIQGCFWLFFVIFIDFYLVPKNNSMEIPSFLWEFFTSKMTGNPLDPFWGVRGGCRSQTFGGSWNGQHAFCHGTRISGCRVFLLRERFGRRERTDFWWRASGWIWGLVLFFVLRGGGCSYWF